MNLPPSNPLRDSMRESYNKQAQERETHTPQAWKGQQRSNFLGMLQQNNKQTLLEIGAGPGHDSKFFQEQGLDVTAVDLSPAMVDLCQQKGLNAYVMDIAELQFPLASFDAVYAMNSLLHLSKAELPAILQRIDTLLKPGGLFFMGVYGGYEFEGIWEQDSYSPRRFFSFFSDEHLKEEVAKVFDILSFQPITFQSDDALHFQSLILQKRLLAG